MNAQPIPQHILASIEGLSAVGAKIEMRAAKAFDVWQRFDAELNAGRPNTAFRMSADRGAFRPMSLAEQKRIAAEARAIAEARAAHAKSQRAQRT